MADFIRTSTSAVVPRTDKCSPSLLNWRPLRNIVTNQNDWRTAKKAPTTNCSSDRQDKRMRQCSPTIFVYPWGQSWAEPLRGAIPIRKLGRQSSHMSTCSAHRRLRRRPSFLCPDEICTRKGRSEALQLTSSDFLSNVTIQLP